MDFQPLFPADVPECVLTEAFPQLNQIKAPWFHMVAVRLDEAGLQ